VTCRRGVERRQLSRVGAARRPALPSSATTKVERNWRRRRPQDWTATDGSTSHRSVTTHPARWIDGQQPFSQSVRRIVWPAAWVAYVCLSEECVAEKRRVSVDDGRRCGGCAQDGLSTEFRRRAGAVKDDEDAGGQAGGLGRSARQCRPRELLYMTATSDNDTLRYVTRTA